LPKVDRLAAELADLAPSHVAAVDAARAAIDAARLQGGSADPSAILADARARRAERLDPALPPVLNATGVILHTNLGRALLDAAACALGAGYLGLELDLATGTRGPRGGAVLALLTELSGAEAALVANNTAAVLILALAALRAHYEAQAKPASHAGEPEVLGARGQLVEIGGSFRIPDILATAGVRLREVGTTNRTYTNDFAAALTPNTIAILRVHPSNFRMLGFVHRAPLAELGALAAAHQLPLLCDLGSDTFAPLPPAAVDPDHETTAQALAAGAALVCFSGDKLLGGPQAGIALGRAHILDAMARHPLMRALRVDKLRLAALEAVLRAYANGTPEHVPTTRMLQLSVETLERRARALAAAIGPAAAPVPTEDAIGGGSHPEHPLPGFGIALRTAPREGRGAAAPANALPADTLAAALRTHTPAILATVAHGAVVLALRTIPPEDDATLARAVASIIRRRMS
jgi:L-seryl-tRNA(Ser) seleniumtransferase